MRPVRDVTALGEHTRRRFLRLRTLSDSVRRPLSVADDRLISFCVIDARTTWENFCRALFLSCLLNARDQGGFKIGCSAKVAKTVEDGIDFAVLTHNPNAKGTKGKWRSRDEPPWHDPACFAKLIGALGPSNETAIQLGLNISTRAFVDVPVFRNFFAHRSAATGRAASRLAPKYSLPSTLHPSVVASSAPHRRPQPILSDWLDDFKTATLLMAT